MRFITAYTFICFFSVICSIIISWILRKEKEKKQPVKVSHPSNTVPFQSSADTDDTGIMIQDFALNIMSAFNSQDFTFFNEPLFNQIEKIESYCLNNIESSLVHTHQDISCKSSRLDYFQSYSRHYVSFHGTVHDDMMTIPVLYCKNDGHYHSILPNSIIVPHIFFSLFFILKVLSAKFFTSLTVKNICDMFQISASTLYRWIKRYNAYLRIFHSWKTGIIRISLYISFMISVMSSMIFLIWISIHFFSMTANCLISENRFVCFFTIK